MRFFTLIIIAMLTVLTGFSGLIYADILDGISEQPGEMVEKDVTGKKIPSFKLKNISGDEILLEDLRDEKLIILMFSSKCPYSINSAKALDELLKDKTELQLMAICLDGEIGNAFEGGKTQKQVAEEFSGKYFKNAKKFEVLLADNNFRSDYSRFFNISKLQITPVHLFVDGNARCKVYIKGSCDSDDLKDAIDKLTE